MKNFKVKWLLLSFILSIASINTAWAETIPANTIIYVDVANLNNGDWDASGTAYYMSVTASENSSHTTTATNTTGAGSYAPKKDTWITLAQVAGNLYAGKVTSQSTTGKVSFWTKNESSYDNCWEVNAALAQSYVSSKRKFTISSDHTNHGDRRTSCFGTTTSSIDLFTGGQKLYLRVGTNWKTKDGSGNSPRFAACFLGQTGQTWAKFTKVTGDYYVVTVPTSGAGEWPYVIVCRMNGGNTTDSWSNVYNQTDDLAPSSDGQGFNNCVWIADDAWSNSSSWTKYAPSPAVWKTDDHDYTTNKFVDGSVGISLNANTTYYFKIADGVEGGWWGCSDNDDYRKSFVGQSEKHTLYSGGIDAQKVIILKTAGAGTYTFHWNSSTHQVSVTYPTVTHPSSDYIYFKNNRKWPNVMGHLFNGTPASTAWHALPVLDSVNFDGTYYHYAAAGGSTNILVAKETTDAWDDKTADLTVSKGKGKWYDVVNKSTKSSEDATKWKTFDATLTLLTTQGETRNPSPTSITVTYGAGTNINTDFISTSPQHTNYSFGGYYTEPGGSGTQVITASEVIPTNLEGYTSSGKWIKTGASVSANLYAKWTQNVTLNKHNDESNGSVTMTYNSNSHPAITTPTRTGYTFTGWYAAADGNALVIATDGTLQNRTSYTDASGKWTNSGSAPTLHAHWTEDTHTVSVAAGSHGSISGSVSSVTGVGIATASSEITAVRDNGYDFVNWTLPTGVTAAAGYSATSNPISINATADGVTITANFTAHTYSITLDKGDHGAADGSATVVFNTSTLASSSLVSANPGYQHEGYYDGNTKVLNVDGTFAGTNVSGYITSGKWSKYDADATLTAKFSPVALTFEGDVVGHATEWNEEDNWSPACVPTIEHDVVIDKPVVVNITDAKAKSVKIYNKESTTHTGKLTIGAGKALVVAEDIKKTEDGSTKIATTADVLHIEAGDGLTGNGALVWGTSGTPGDAQVDFYTAALGVKGNTTSKNQYIGTPFSNDQQVLYQFYYSWVYKIEYSDDGEPYWTPLASDAAMNEFEGYDLISAYNAATTYQMEGTLVSNGNVTLTTGTTPALYYNGSSKTENVLANSWVAPIKINTMDATNNFSNVEGTIYIFNMGSETDGSGGTGGGAGNYSTYTIGSAGETVIPSMQSFSVYTTGSSPSLTLNYTNSVKTPVANGTMNSANRAPARNLADEMDLLKLNVASENGWGDELKFYIHEDFTNEFENGWDGHKMFGYPEAPQLYAVSNDGELAVACVPTAENNVIAFTPGSEDNEYTFSFTYDGDEEYYLKDTKLNIETLINTEATYTFTSEAQDSEMRFIIIKHAPAVATDVETSDIKNQKSDVQKILHNGQLYIIRDGGIYSTDGQMVK